MSIETILEFMTGEHGGIVAMALGTGAAAGYTFAMRTALKEARTALEEAKRDRDMWRDKYLGRVDD